jgi:primosomal protein N' (replication factor Y)
VPLRVLRVAKVERAQLLLESAHRPALQAFVRYWGPQVAQLAKQHKVRITIEVDPLEI